jgi:hypothetical protein
MSVWMQSAPYDLRGSDWNQRRDTLGDTVVNLIEEYAPGFKNSILHRQILTPFDLEQEYGLTGGHSTMPKWLSTKSSSCARFPVGRAITRRSKIFTSAVPARIPAAALPASPAITPPRKSSRIVLAKSSFHLGFFRLP